MLVDTRIKLIFKVSTKKLISFCSIKLKHPSEVTTSKAHFACVERDYNDAKEHFGFNRPMEKLNIRNIKINKEPADGEL